MGTVERIGEWLDEHNADRRVVAILLLLILMLIGGGIGTFILSIPPDEGTPVTTATPSVTPTPTPTATPDGGGIGPATPTSPTPTDAPTETETPTAAPTEAPGGGGGGGVGGGSGSTPTATPSPETPSPTPTATPTEPPTPTPSGQLVFTTERRMLDVDGIYPGQSGSGSTTVRSTATEDGEIRIAEITVEDFENGINDPESEVDDSPDEGELSEHLEVTIALDHEDRPPEHVLGTENGYETLATLRNSQPSSAVSLDPGEEMDVLVEWQLPEETGNVVQTDGVEFDVTLELRGDG